MRPIPSPSAPATAAMSATRKTGSFVAPQIPEGPHQHEDQAPVHHHPALVDPDDVEPVPPEVVEVRQDVEEPPPDDDAEQDDREQRLELPGGLDPLALHEPSHQAVTAERKAITSMKPNAGIGREPHPNSGMVADHGPHGEDRRQHDGRVADRRHECC